MLWTTTMLQNTRMQYIVNQWLGNMELLLLLSRFSCIRLFVTLWTIAHQAPSLGKNTGVGCHAILQGFLAQGSNMSLLQLLNCRQILYCCLQHRTLLLSPVTSTTGYCLCFGSIPSLFLELFLHWSPVAYWAPSDLGSSFFSILSFCLFIPFMGFSRQEYQSGLPFPSPVDHILWGNGKVQFSFQSHRKAMPKNAQTTTQLHSSHTLVK